MLLKHWMLGVALVASAPWALADVAVDPLYGDDPQARAVLDCQADYARRYAGAVTSQRATATEVAIAAHAGCIDAFEAFIRSRVTAAGEAERMQAAMNPAAFVEHHRQRMRDYAHAHTLHVYLRSTADF
ncbi:hypothetical protein ABB25_11595 [Stenotrophomonas koreensis]|uniref:UrcA family protein n=1 Tax=Stenotrophomonas koreensis TaxID=266128 RepID=A0A0R0BRL6_9GAMM|nr:hypothetical protein [Stenotrophomonas koreensis]KRG55752.1 hypothetical protein ABB25_11595 [Stenotrophomonas koreensis]